MEIDPVIAIRATIKPGSVFYFVEDSYRSDEPHYFVVLNQNPATAETLLLVSATSQVEKRIKWVESKNIGYETLVGIEPSQLEVLKEYSIFDCNFPILKNLEFLVTKLTDGELKHKTYVSNEILKKLRDAVQASPIVENSTKQLLSRHTT